MQIGYIGDNPPSFLCLPCCRLVLAAFPSAPFGPRIQSNRTVCFFLVLSILPKKLGLFQPDFFILRPWKDSEIDVHTRGRPASFALVPSATGVIMAASFSLSCQTDFIAIGLQQGEDISTAIRIAATLISLSISSAWCRWTKIRRLSLFFAHWLRYACMGVSHVV